MKEAGFDKVNKGEHQRAASTYNTAAMIQQLQNTEDVYMQIIHELQFDRLRLKGKDMMSRIA